MKPDINHFMATGYSQHSGMLMKAEQTLISVSYPLHPLYPPEIRQHVIH